MFQIIKKKRKVLLWTIWIDLCDDYFADAQIIDICQNKNHEYL